MLRKAEIIAHFIGLRVMLLKKLKLINEIIKAIDNFSPVFAYSRMKHSRGGEIRRYIKTHTWLCGLRG